MKLNLTKPLIFFDLETTGLDITKDRIVQIAILKVFPDGKEISQSWIVNPSVPIPVNASKIHGIYDKDVQGKPLFQEIAKELAAIFHGADIAGYNSNKFDIPLLAEEFIRAETDIDLKKNRFVDVQVIFFKMEQRTLRAAYQFYCERDLVNAHSADADTKATYEILQAQLERYNNLTNDIGKLSDFTTQGKSADFAGRIVYNEAGVEIFNFGKHKGKPVVDILKEEPGYYSWMMNGDFPLYTKKVLTAIKLRTAFDNVK